MEHSKQQPIKTGQKGPIRARHNSEKRLQRAVFDFRNAQRDIDMEDCKRAGGEGINGALAAVNLSDPALGLGLKLQRGL